MVYFSLSFPITDVVIVSDIYIALVNPQPSSEYITAQRAVSKRHEP